MLYRIAKRHLRENLSLAAHLAHEHREICGLVIENGLLLELVRLPNRTRRRGKFRMLEKDLKPIELAARRLRHRVVGSFHSHPVSEAKPGPGDRRGAQIGSLMLVIDCIGQEARLWRIGRNKRAYAVRYELV
jgi:proteasome lid subunit RPN8/RPN11